MDDQSWKSPGEALDVITVSEDEVAHWDLECETTYQGVQTHKTLLTYRLREHRWVSLDLFGKGRPAWALPPVESSLSGFELLELAFYIAGRGCASIARQSSIYRRFRTLRKRGLRRLGRTSGTSGV